MKYKHKARFALQSSLRLFGLGFGGCETGTESHGVSEAAEAFGGQRPEVRQAEGVARP